MPDEEEGEEVMSATDVLWEGTARAIGEAAEAWKREEESAARATAAEALVRAALGLISITEGIIAHTWDDLFSERIRQVQAMGDHLESFTTQAISVADQMRELALCSETEGHKVEKLPELSEAIERLARAKEALARRWPRFDSEELERGLAQVARGETVGAEEILREFPELQNPAGA